MKYITYLHQIDFSDKILEFMVFCGLGTIYLLGALNSTLATIGLMISIALGFIDGFSLGVKAIITIFGLLFMGETAKNCGFAQDDFFKLTLPNIIASFFSFLWLLLPCLLIYSLYVGGNLAKHYHTYLITIILIMMANLPLLIFHSLLCFKDVRLWYAKQSKQDEEISKFDLGNSRRKGCEK